jgi:FlaA1/EpsC-like NDP-sugar epimerase
MRFDGDLSSMPYEIKKNIVYVFIAATVVKIVSFALFKLYNSLWRYASIHEMINIVGATFVGNVISMSCVFILRVLAERGTVIIEVTVPASLFIIAFLMDIFLIGGSRFAYRVFRRAIKGEVIRFKNCKRVLTRWRQCRCHNYK